MQLVDRRGHPDAPEIRIALCIGKTDFTSNINVLTDLPVDIIVATPGRLRHLVMEDTVRFEKLRFIVVDEARLLLGDSLESQMRELCEIGTGLMTHADSNTHMISKIFLSAGATEKDIDYVTGHFFNWRNKLRILTVGIRLTEAIETTEKPTVIESEEERFGKMMGTTLDHITNENRSCNVIVIVCCSNWSADELRYQADETTCNRRRRYRVGHIQGSWKSGAASN